MKERDLEKAAGASTPIGRRLSFNKRPFPKPVSRRTSQMSGISNYPPQDISPVQCDEDFVKFHQRYRGVSFCGNDVDYDERIRVPRMSLSSMFFHTAAASGDSSNSGLNSLKEEDGGDGYDYKPASFDLTKGLRNIDSSSSPLLSTPLVVVPPPLPSSSPPILNTDFNMKSATLKKIKSNISDGISPNRLLPNKDNPPKQINQAYKCDYTPTVLRQIDTNNNVYSPIKKVSTNNINSNIVQSNQLRWDNEPIRSHWKMDMERESCFGCGSNFTLFLRRHHCRHCGDIFCFECLKYGANLNVLAKFEKPQHHHDVVSKVSKVCKGCYDSYLEFLKMEGDFEGYKKQQQKQQQGDTNVLGSSIPSDWVWSSF